MSRTAKGGLIALAVLLGGVAGVARVLYSAPTATVQAHLVSVTGSPAVAGWECLYRVVYSASEDANSALLGERNGVNYILYPDPTLALDFRLTGEGEAVFQQLKADNPQLNESNVHESHCWGGFKSDGTCAGDEPVLIRPKLDCLQDGVSVASAQIFEYRLRIDVPFVLNRPIEPTVPASVVFVSKPNTAK
jgi:hypothetical protein